MESRASSRIWPILLLLSIVVAQADTGSPASPLGLEPGDLRLCNDDMGIIVWGPNDAITLSVGKSDIWDRRNPKPPEPVLTLAQMKEMARAGDKTILNGAAYYSAYNSHDFPCPKPAGQLILQLPFMHGGGTLRVDKQVRQIVLVASNGPKKLTLRAFVSAVENIIAISGESDGLQSGDVAIRSYRHRDTIVPGGEKHPTIGGGLSPMDFELLPIPRAGADSEIVWVAQDFGSEPTFPKGFTSVLAATTSVGHADAVAEGELGLGTPMRAEKEGRITHALTKRYTPINESPGSAATARLEAIGPSFFVFATVATTQDGDDPVAHARQTLQSARVRGFEALWSDHEKQLDVYDQRSHARAARADGTVIFDQVWGGIPYRVRPAGYYGDIVLCSVDSTKYCYQDSAPWHADFHFNEIDATPLCAYRQFDLLEGYLNMIRALLPMAQANARQIYDCPGAMYPLVHYPLKADSVIHTHLTWEQSVELTALLVKPFWLRYQYTGDVAFLRDEAYPALREGARFYSAYVSKEDDGVYHVVPTVSPEHRGITKDFQFNKDSQSALTMVRYNLRVAATAAEILDVDSDEAARWREIEKHLAPYPTVESPEGPIFIDVSGAKPIEYNIPVPLSAVFWGDDIGLDSPPAQLEVARRTARLIDVWEPHRGYLIRVRARLGVYEPSDPVTVDHLLQSHTGVIRVFPTVAPNFEGSIENLGAQGGFIVSAKRGATGVESITIQSLTGSTCVLANPWGRLSPRVADADGNAPIPVEMDGDRIRFATARDHGYVVTPS